MINKLLNDPTLRIKEFAEAPRGEVYLDAVTRLFNLEDGSALRKDGSVLREDGSALREDRSDQSRETDAAEPASKAVGGLVDQGGAAGGRQ